MATQMTVTEVRDSMSQFFDTVVHERPAVLVRRRRDSFMAIDTSKMGAVLKPYRFSMEYEYGEDGRVYGSLEQIPDLIGEGDTPEELRRDLAEQLIDYAQSYEKEFKLFFNAPNRKDHFPYVLRVLMQDDLEAVVNLIGA